MNHADQHTKTENVQFPEKNYRMKKLQPALLLLSAILIFNATCFSQKNSSKRHLNKYVPDDQKLYNTIVYWDSIFFEAYNTCALNLDKYATFFSDSIEFYHDQGGLMTSKPDIIEATKRNVCGKVTRELIKGSIEVYPINNYGAVEIGFHKFHNNQEKAGTASKVGRFVIIWQNKNNDWKITRVISLH